MHTHETPVHLEIGIPTYNRAPKLARVLALLRAQIVRAGLTDRVTIHISDNASTDATPEVCAQATALDDGVTVRVVRQPENLGFNGNVWSMYRSPGAEYLWTFADDDLPLEGAVETVYGALAEHRPDFLMFSFVQPPGSTARTFDLPEPVTVVTDRGAMARLTCLCPKISLYVYRRVALPPADIARMDAQVRESGYAYTALALSILGAAEAPRLAIVSRPLATCDDDFNVLRISPHDWGRTHQMWQHPFVQRWAPDLAADALRASYLNQLSFLWSWRAGGVSVEPDYVPAWWDAIRDLKPAWPWLLGSPGSLVRFAVLKTAPGTLPRALNTASTTVRALRARLRDPAGHP